MELQDIKIDEDNNLQAMAVDLIAKLNAHGFVVALVIVPTDSSDSTTFRLLGNIDQKNAARFFFEMGKKLATDPGLISKSLDAGAAA
jgi:hypothetical protein